MNLPVPKNDKSKVPLPHLPALPSMLNNLLPMNAPQLPYKPGLKPIVELLIHGTKMAGFNWVSESERKIAENKLAQTRAQFKQMEEVLLFGPRYELALKEIKHKLQMFDLEAQNAQADFVHKQLTNMLLQSEVQRVQLELQQFMKELGISMDNGNGNGNGAASQ